MKETPEPMFRVINGGRNHLENAIMKQMAEGTLSKDTLDRLKPKGNLRLVHSHPLISKKEEDDWLNFEDLNS